MSSAMPPAEVAIDVDLVRALVARQHPDLADRPLRFFGEGWDNVMYRLGDDLSVRVPRRQVVADLIGVEQRWLPILAPTLPLAVPAPVRVGAPDPDRGYPWPWSILPWLPGEPADIARPGPGQGLVLADFLRALHHPAPADAPTSEIRGVSLATRVDALAERFERLGDRVSAGVRGIWADALAVPEHDGTATWVHGDLHAANVLVDDGEFSAVIDWIDLNAGDPATDLAAVWMLLPDQGERRAALRGYDPDEALSHRARGWAVNFGVLLLDTGLVDHPGYAAMGEAILARLEHDAGA